MKLTLLCATDIKPPFGIFALRLCGILGGIGWFCCGAIATPPLMGSGQHSYAKHLRAIMPFGRSWSAVQVEAAYFSQQTWNANAAWSVHESFCTMEAALFLHRSHGLTVKARGGANTTAPPDANKRRALWGSFSSPPPFAVS